MGACVCMNKSIVLCTFAFKHSVENHNGVRIRLFFRVYFEFKQFYVVKTLYIFYW